MVAVKSRVSGQGWILGLGSGLGVMVAVKSRVSGRGWILGPGLGLGIVFRVEIGSRVLVPQSGLVSGVGSWLGVASGSEICSWFQVKFWDSGPGIEVDP